MVENVTFINGISSDNLMTNSILNKSRSRYNLITQKLNFHRLHSTIFEFQKSKTFNFLKFIDFLE